MDKFTDRVQTSDIGVEYIDLTDAEAEHYSGAGDAIVFVDEQGMVEAIDYIHDIEEDGAKAAVQKSYDHGRAYYCMCSSYQLCDIKPMSDLAMAARIIRLVAENFDY